MARISLRQNSGGARPTDHAAPITNPHSDMRMQGISAMTRAGDRLAHGINYVAGAVGDIAKDQARMENEIAVNSAQVSIVKEQAALNEDFRRRITAGEFKDFKSFQNAYLEDYSSKIETPLNEKFHEEGLSDAARQALAVHIKKSQAANFAHMGAEWQGIQNRRKIDALYSDLSALEEMDASDEDIGRMVAPYVNGGLITPETGHKILLESSNRRTTRRLDLERAKLRLASSPEEFDKALEAAMDSPAYKASSGVQKEYFDVFAAAAGREASARAERARAASAKAAHAADSERKALADSELRGVESELSLAARESLRLAASAEDLGRFMLDFDSSTRRMEEILASSNYSDAQKSVARERFYGAFDDEQAKLSKQIKAKLKNSAFEKLKSAVLENGGLIPSDDLKDPLLSKQRREAELFASFEKLAPSVDFSTLAPKLQEQAAALLTPEEKAEYEKVRGVKGKSDAFWREWFAEYRVRREAQERAGFVNALGEINRYEYKSDETGENLALIMRKTQTFSPERRRTLMEALYNKASGASPNEKWSYDDVKQFNASFAEFCEHNTDTYDFWRYDDTVDPVLFLELRNRVFNAAKVRGLTLQEAVREMEEDPFYREIFQKRNRQKALEFINGR